MISFAEAYHRLTESVTEELQDAGVSDGVVDWIETLNLRLRG